MEARHFAWEYKRKGSDLRKAYEQLSLYRDDLLNPPLLIVSDLVRFEVYTNFTNTNPKVHSFALDDLHRPEIQDLLRSAFTDPEKLNPKYQSEKVTQAASQSIGQVARALQDRSHDPQKVAHFMMQLVFAFFAEDAGLLPKKLVTRILERTQERPERAQQYLSELFRAMSTGGEVLLEDVAHFNGGLFEGSGALPLEPAEIAALLDAGSLDWAEVEPAIFGTLFERSLDPTKRSQLGAHYTSKEDILRVVNPVILDPLREEWRAVRAGVQGYLERQPEGKRTKARVAAVSRPIQDFLTRLHTLKVLDPACGSGNFLYVTMQGLLELQRDVLNFAVEVGEPPLQQFVTPEQFLGLEVNVFAHELASIVVWIGYLQWKRANAESSYDNPILRKLETIQHRDALLSADGLETVWPDADYIVGNPPFLGDKKMRSELGDPYVDRLRKRFEGRVPGQADFVCYWFEKARAKIEAGTVKRAGLIATNSISGGKNREVLERIKQTGDIFMAWSDEPWVLDGAAVRVAMIGFDDGSVRARVLDRKSVAVINADLTSSTDVTKAKPLRENSGVSFMGTTKVGAFDIPKENALQWLAVPNPSGKSNAEVIKPWINGRDVVQRPSDTWIVDFALMSEVEAQQYLLPYQYALEKIKPERDKNNRAVYREKWWLHAEPRPALRKALSSVTSYIATPRVAKHRIFAKFDVRTLPDSRLFVFTVPEADFAFGLLSSRIHELWSLAQGGWHGVGNDPQYNNTTCFETFPFPRPTPEQKAEIEKWAKYLDTVRSGLLAADAKATLTGLYNALQDLRKSRDSGSPVYPLLLAHERLDAAVAAAYGWEWPLAEEQVLERLLALNLERSAAPVRPTPGGTPLEDDLEAEGTARREMALDVGKKRARKSAKKH